MEAVAAVLVGSEPSWLHDEFMRLVATSAVVGRYRVAQRCPRGAEDCLILTDDLQSGRLRRVIWACIGQMEFPRVGLLAWDAPQHASGVVGIPYVRLVFPLADPTSARELLRSMAEPTHRPDLLGSLPKSLPPSLAMALRLAIRRSEDPTGPPPPHRVSQLAPLVPCQPETLYRSAREQSLDLSRILKLAAARWLRLAIESRTVERQALASALGYSSSSGFHRFVRAVLRTTPGQTGMVPLERIEADLLQLLSVQPEVRTQPK